MWERLELIDPIEANLFPEEDISAFLEQNEQKRVPLLEWVGLT